MENYLDYWIEDTMALINEWIRGQVKTAMVSCSMDSLTSGGDYDGYHS